MRMRGLKRGRGRGVTGVCRHKPGTVLAACSSSLSLNYSARTTRADHLDLQNIRQCTDPRENSVKRNRARLQAAEDIPNIKPTSS